MADLGQLYWPQLSLSEARAAVLSREVSSRELVQAAIEQAQLLDPALGVCVLQFADHALGAADAADRALAADWHMSSRRPLLGLPIAVKDNIDLAGWPTTAGTALLREHVPDRDAEVVATLRQAGAVIVAKTNLDELALGGQCHSTVGGSSRNPWDGVSVPGGSSGGSGASVAAGMALAALGTDTGGSIRNPSAWCGVVGFKPTFAALSTRGVVPLAWSLDTVGFLCGQVADAALLLASATSRPELVSLAERLLIDRKPPSPWPKIGYVPDLIGLSRPAVREVFEAAVHALDAVAHTSPVCLPSREDSLAATMLIVLAEGAAAWEWALREQWQELGPEIRGLLDLGRLVRAGDYLQAQRVREQMRRDVDRLFAQVDFLAMPSMGLDPGPDVFAEAGPLGPDNPIMQLATGFTCLWNLTGCPVVSVPCGFTAGGWPAALQIVGRPGDDTRTLEMAAAAEAAFGLSRAALEPTWARRHRTEPARR